MTEKRVILIIGKANSGKSALANTISNTDTFRENKFETTEKTQIKHFRIKGKNIEYQIIDTIGVKSNTNLTIQNLLTDVAFSIKSGLNQILFVMPDDQLTEEEKNLFRTIKNINFGDKLPNFITIIRNKFPKFRESIECKEDREKNTGTYL